MGAIRFDNVGRIYGNKQDGFEALKGVELEIADKEFMAVVGPSGCGKTTCLRFVAGFDRPTSGMVSVDGVKVTKPGPDRAVVFQQFALMPWKTVRENIELGLRNKGVPRAERRERIDRILALMNLTGYADAFPHQLSGGMQQRVSIARAYVLDPEVLLMDEPFGALDAQTRVVMQEELVRLARRNPRTVMFITHAVEEAVYLADRVAIMARQPGRVKEIIDIRSIREAERWDDHEKIEDVMDLESFVHLRTQIWRSLRQEKAMEIA
ncbi:ABC transporter ATP-binding protein (plasmid) [Paracoccus versutus]|uniref:NitT/TauT family transport system ATP-binding protein n=1 Tax=Paracoccus versutus TaxID=34007 RepID=A0AAQ0HDM6_PARVE|nr:MULTISPECIES: ABC transporter ATP-binding protein [Paracoccus]WGR62009.1 ABC transporter ATP-binding protein [Paracoccus ferrooxidans]SFY42361.1 NitT/TauT family transport system ATP-binding protein [Paracoccus pantotrophus]KGJ07121.1 ABC transporter ATP-binding protein [Paracoccus versutus]MBT0782867.1 ABC transporter ATP-binding protein [Paracoccus sp. pheM1]REG31648.1 NitT/TauT family transport system ATP-binding protein [Paracoccus versutus]